MNRTILVLDDDVDTRRLARLRLERALPGITVLECGDPHEAVSVAGSTRIDGVMTDHHLGAAEGTEIVAQLRAAGVAGPIVMFTGSSDPAVYRRAYEAGAARVFAGTDTDYVGYFKAEFAR